MTRKTRHLTAIATLAIGVALGTKADATITFLPGNNPQPGEENILFGAKETGTTINGATSRGKRCGAERRVACQIDPNWIWERQPGALGDAV
jgi:hypothetical protein